MEGYITIKEVCEIFNITEMTVLRWRKKGMPCYKVGRKVMFIKNEIDQWIKSHRE